MKKKLIALITAIALLAVASIGFTLAYFTDTDSAVNVLTSGNVEILLHEDNDNGLLDDEYREWLEAQPFLPGVTLEKDVWVENTGTNPAYVRLFIAFPYNAKDLMTLNWDDLTANGWTDDISGYTANATYDELNAETVLDGDGYYTVNIGTEKYIVRCLTLKDALEPGAKTADTLTSVYMLSETEAVSLDGEAVEYSNKNVTYDPDGTGPEAPEALKYVSEDGKVPVYIHAQAVQVVKNENENFTVFEAFNAAFNAYDQAWWVDGVSVEDTQFITGAVTSRGALVTVDEPVSNLNIIDANITADTLAEINADSWMKIADSTVDVDNGIILKNNNTTVLLDNVHFDVEEGPLVTSNGGGQVIYILSPIYINGVEYDFSTAMQDTYFHNVLVLKMY